MVHLVLRRRSALPEYSVEARQEVGPMAAVVVMGAARTRKLVLSTTSVASG
ncbi:hypothetical protein SSPIM334S_04244 [Streptomyces spiroverticillatus]